MVSYDFVQSWSWTSHSEIFNSCWDIMVSYLCFSFEVYIIGILLGTLSKYLAMKCLCGLRAMVITVEKCGFVWGCFWSLSLFLSLAWSSSSSCQSDDIANSFGYILHSWVQIAQYLEMYVIFAVAAGEVGENVDGVSISLLPCMGVRLV